MRQRPPPTTVRQHQRDYGGYEEEAPSEVPRRRGRVDFSWLPFRRDIENCMRGNVDFGGGLAAQAGNVERARVSHGDRQTHVARKASVQRCADEG
ncbi:hypothetical protein TTRE_0000933701 [Trichuris trichiura]|uniref:Uncharacterized protein n=1 Tax=Trichuris trichiura TaxID=36087 RepID=A0A077ZKN8_TRITR|nr:hypothetical protein TTRE_0000933701 [Trichuris trichiura]